MPILGDPAWVGLHFHSYQQHVSDRHRSGRKPDDMQRFLADKVWSRIKDLHSKGGLYLLRSKQELNIPGYKEKDMPDIWYDVQVVNRAVRSMRSTWPEGFTVMKSSLEGRAANTTTLSRVKFYLLGEIVNVSIPDRVDSLPLKAEDSG
jgi:hypothetical protein